MRVHALAAHGSDDDAHAQYRPQTTKPGPLEVFTSTNQLTADKAIHILLREASTFTTAAAHSDYTRKPPECLTYRPSITSIFLPDLSSVPYQPFSFADDSLGCLSAES